MRIRGGTKPDTDVCPSDIIGISEKELKTRQIILRKWRVGHGQEIIN